MELFVINRYTGEESNKAETPDENSLREKLLQKINERKRQNELLASEVTKVSKPKKRKKFKDEEENQDEITEEYEETHKKRKKKKSNEIIKNEEEEEVTPDENQKPVKQKKHKKKKEKKEIEETEDKEEMNGVEKDENENIGVENEKQSTGFTILGDVHMFKKEKVKRKLPNWLANPSIVSVDLKNLTHTIDSIPELDKVFVDKLKENKITHFFPVQSQIIPWLLKNADRPNIYWPNDICVSAPTGSGKTLAFVLPILQVLCKRIVPRVRALVVLPVQDLAAQVFKVFETYGTATNLKILLLSQKRPFHEEQSLICRNDGMGNYRILVDIIVTTPGRLVEHLTKTKGFCLDDLRYLVIDEADKVMEKAQNDWLYHLNKHINSDCTRSYQAPIISYSIMHNKKRPPNKLLFSATLSQDPEKLQQLGLFHPKLFTSVVKSKTENEGDVKDEARFVGKYTTPAELTEFYTCSTKANKPLIVHHILQTKSWKNVLCFVNSVEATSRLAFVLKSLSKKTLKISKLSANLTVRKRDIVLKKFSNGEIDVLVSSDALARGIDIPNVEYVISYDAPKFIKTYVHRIGRTGRAGKEGTSLVLLTSKEVNRFQKMIEDAGKNSVQELQIDSDQLTQYEELYEAALSSLGKTLEKRKQLELRKSKKTKKVKLKAARGNLKSLKNNNNYKIQRHKKIKE